MKKYLFTMKIGIAFFLLFIGARVYTQVNITAIPPGPRFTIDDLWNLTMVKTNALSTQIHLNLILNVFDSRGSKILSATTSNFQFSRNVFSVNKSTINKIQPISLHYFQNKFQNNLGKQGGLFPAGNYKIEFVLNAVGTSSGGASYTEPLGRTSYNINALLVYPIQLVSVYNNDTITDPTPNFTWIPPYPLPEGNVTYQITITEILPDQTPIFAIKENFPMLKKGVLNKSNEYYSEINPDLVKGKEYAWSVNAYDTKGNLISGSETWKFIYDEIDSLIYVPDQYYVMGKKLFSSYVVIDSNILPIKFSEEYKILDSLSHVYLFNSTFDTIATEVDIPIYYKQGSNYTYINFCPDVFPIDNGMYVLQIILLNDEKYYLRFKNESEVGVCVYE